MVGKLSVVAAGLCLHVVSHVVPCVVLLPCCKAACKLYNKDLLLIPANTTLCSAVTLCKGTSHVCHGNKDCTSVYITVEDVFNPIATTSSCAGFTEFEACRLTCGPTHHTLHQPLQGHVLQRQDEQQRHSKQGQKSKRGLYSSHGRSIHIVQLTGADGWQCHGIDVNHHVEPACLALGATDCAGINHIESKGALGPRGATGTVFSQLGGVAEASVGDIDPGGGS